jgi:hypothetical protein
MSTAGSTEHTLVLDVSDFKPKKKYRWRCVFFGTVGIYAIETNCYKKTDEYRFMYKINDDPTRIHTLRKYVGQAKGNAGVETVRAKQ